MACYLCENDKPRELTPELLADFENGCYMYFLMKDADGDKQVGKSHGIFRM
jgi:hypothetical protein